MATRKRPLSADAKQPARKQERLPPGQRGVQRATKEQLDDDSSPARGDEPTAWERGLQERLPPRGVGSQHNQGDDKEARTVRDEVPEDVGPAPSTIAQAGGARGPGKPAR
jgi:hypothetical protein